MTSDSRLSQDKRNVSLQPELSVADKYHPTFETAVASVGYDVRHYVKSLLIKPASSPTLCFKFCYKYFVIFRATCTVGFYLFILHDHF